MVKKLTEKDTNYEIINPKFTIVNDIKDNYTENYNKRGFCKFISNKTYFKNTIKKIIESSTGRGFSKFTPYKNIFKLLENDRFTFDLYLHVLDNYDKVFNKVLKIFQNSNVLTRAYEFGKTALMYAVESKLFYLKTNYFNNENALFHTTKNKSAFKIVLDSNIRLNQLNINHESILYLIKKEIINTDIEDNDEKTEIMFLTEDGKNSEILTLNLRN
ncbi:hypothetical protein H8356DRAFT_1352956 [Neocallimastix lanati (nom. inval.)]|nr:hypothetical protein H8356DRAFT_1352956 [Neocallimastix sp. JGI-2020a]